MNKQQIDKLATDYADAIIPNRHTYDDDALWGEHHSIAKQVLTKLSDKYLFVEREKIEELKMRGYSDCLSDDYAISQHGYATLEILQNLFPNL